MRNFFFGADGIKTFINAFACSYALDVVAGCQFVMYQLGGREYAEARGAECGKQCAVFEFTGDARHHFVAFKPKVNFRTNRGMRRG